MRSFVIGDGKYEEVYLSYLKEAGVDVVDSLDDDPDGWDKIVDDVRTPWADF